jgi:hypothetical protein
MFLRYFPSWPPEFDMRNALLIGLIALLLQPVGAQDGKDSVVGLWLGETRTQGGLGNWIDFHADGTVEVGFGALVGALLDDRYRLEGTTLTLRVYSGKITPDGVPVFESVQTTVQLQGEHAVVASQWRDDQPVPEINSPAEQAMVDRLRQPVTMTRVGPAPPAASLIAGTWFIPALHGPDGVRDVLRVPMSLQHGRYTVTPAAVIVQSAQQSDTFTREGDVLMEGAADGKHSTYRRAPE